MAANRVVTRVTIEVDSYAKSHLSRRRIMQSNVITLMNDLLNANDEGVFTKL